MPHRRTRDTEQMDRILHWAVQSQGQWRSINTGLSPDRHRGWPHHPSQRSGGYSTITEEREVSLSRQHPSKNSLTTICDRIWQTGEWPTPWTQSLVITLPKKGNLQQCQNYQTISHISHQSKVMLKTKKYWTDWSLKRRRSLLKSRQASGQEGAPQSRPSH